MYPTEPGFAQNSSTSKEAAGVLTQQVDNIRQKVFEHIKKVGGATCSEIEEALGLRHQTASARIRELVLFGQIRDSSHVRRTGSGRKAVVWEVV